MQVPNRITLVLRAQEGTTLESVCLHAMLGASVTIGPAETVIASVHEGDRDEVAHQLEHQLTLAEAAIKRGVRPGCGLRIDDWIATVANSRRYEFLRDHALRTGHANVPMVRIGLGNPIGWFDLDSEIDQAMGRYPGADNAAEQAVQGQHP